MDFDFDLKMKEAIENISYNHRKIIDDWCKAYLAQLYEERVEIKPGSFTLNEQHLDNVGGSVLGKKYWFEKGKPYYSGWISVNEKLPESDDKILVTNGKEVYQGYEYNVFPDERPYAFWVDDYLFIDITHWMPMPTPPNIEE